MKRTHYRVASNWVVPGNALEVAAVFAEPTTWAQWWPAAFLDVKELPCSGDSYIGRAARIHSKGWLPYTLRLQAAVTECNYPHGCTFTVTGDFEGRCVCVIEERTDRVEVSFDWDVRVRKPLLRGLSWAFKPAFEANHRWVMRRGNESLRIELARRRARTDEAVTVPPPGPTFPYGRRLPRLARWCRTVGNSLATRRQRPGNSC
jgi:hypothetical protein